MHSIAYIRLMAIGLLLAFTGSSFGQFWDQGFLDGAARSDFDLPSTGTASDPLQYGICLFDPTPTNPCVGPSSWPQSNWTEFGNTSGGFWVFSHNDESWHLNQDGPPNQSHAIGEPGQSGFGFHYGNIQGHGADDGAHIIINTDLLHSVQHDQWQEMPFFSIGAERDRGNNGVPPAQLNGLDHWYYGTNQYLSFNAQLRHSSDGSHGGSYRHAGMYILAEWGEASPNLSFPRGIFILLHEDADSHPLVNGSLIPDGFGYMEWNWPFQQSYFYPGAEWAFLTVSHLNEFCPQAVLASADPLNPILATGNFTHYRFHLTKLFECVDLEYGVWSDPFPTSTVVDVRGIHWYVEGAAATEEQETPSVQLWLQINNPRVKRL